MGVLGWSKTSRICSKWPLYNKMVFTLDAKNIKLSRAQIVIIAGFYETIYRTLYLKTYDVNKAHHASRTIKVFNETYFRICCLYRAEDSNICSDHRTLGSVHREGRGLGDKRDLKRNQGVGHITITKHSSFKTVSLTVFVVAVVVRC